jgi:hypothetical protein
MRSFNATLAHRPTGGRSAAECLASQISMA